MHLICLGVVRKLLNFWCSGKPLHKFSFPQIECISNCMISLKPFIACEFVRKPQSQRELKRFKATEYKQFLFYTRHMPGYKRVW